MTADDLVAALDLPAATRVDQRVPKKLFLENGAPTAADRRAITDGVKECRWVAALKPHTIGVPEYRDGEREYVEIHVLRLTAASAAKITRLTELVHRAVPYPLLLVHEHGNTLALSAAHKRHSLGEAGKTVLESPPVAVDVSSPAFARFQGDFAAAILLAKQPQASLYALYSGWLDTLEALLAAGRTGQFRLCDTRDAADVRRQALETCAAADAEVARIRAAAARETQVARQAELNKALRAVRAKLSAAEADL
jgi:hypothetical protein